MAALHITFRRAAGLALLALVFVGCAGAENRAQSGTRTTPASLTERTHSESTSGTSAPDTGTFSPEGHPRQDDDPRQLIDLDPASIGLSTPTEERLPVKVGIFLTTRLLRAPSVAERSWSEADARTAIRRLVERTNAILAQCGLHVAVESAQVVALPDRLLRLQGNAAGSWGGHPPSGTENPELFNYQQNERLTDDVRELFGYGKQHTSPNTIAVFVVEHITYYAEQELTEAGGLSFPPNVYHHADDYPLRNGVLLVGSYPAGDGLPVIPSETALAHELGHMLLNSGDHERDERNLMSGWGTLLSSAQCGRMRHNLDRLFGAAAVPDPGPP